MLGDMTQVHCQFPVIQPRLFLRTVGKIMTEVVKGHLTDKWCFCFGRCRFQLLQPLMERALMLALTVLFLCNRRTRLVALRFPACLFTS